MAVIANRRSVMTLFSNASCPHSHRVRMVLAEKGINVEIVTIDPDNLPEDLIDLNPYQSVPTLVDRELVLYDPQVITEYLDERFPHPPLMPVDPVSRARSRLALFRIKKDWYSLLDDLETGAEKAASKARKTLRDSLASSAEVFADDAAFEGMADLVSQECVSRAGYFDPRKVTLLFNKARRSRTLGERDNMALVGILSTQAWHHLFIEGGGSEVQYGR